MTAFQAFILALVQGITEFLPISSSAHLILLPRLLGWDDQGLKFDVITNTGTLAALLIYFRQDLATLVREQLRFGALPAAKARSNLGPILIVATIPVMLAGLLFYGWISSAARDPHIIAFTSIFFGLLLWWADRAFRHERVLDELRWKDGIIVGLSEALALVPGTSRSGITMTAGLALGFNREAAARFSFLLAIPVSFAALAMDIRQLWLEGPPAGGWVPLFIGFTVSGVSAYLVIGWLLDWVKRQDLTLFVGYRVLLGLVILFLEG